MEKKLLEAALNSRDAYEIIHNIAVREDFSDYSYAIYEMIGNYYQIDEEAQSIDLSLLSSRIEEKYPRQHGELLSVLQELGDTSIPNVLEELVHLKRKALGRELAAILVNSPDSQKAKDMMEGMRELETVTFTPPVPASDTAEELLTELADRTNLIRLYPDSLNERIDGGAIGGNHIVVFARPNCGKTAFTINLSRGLLRDGRKILYIANEEPSKQVLQRLVSRINNKTIREMDSDIPMYVQKARPLLENFYITDLTPGTFGDIRSLIKDIHPDVVIIDQLRNVRLKEDNRVLQLEKLAMESRNLAKSHDVLVVSITQAGDSGRNKLVLDDGDIDFSNTGIAATCDLIIGMGVNDEMRTKGQRVLTIVKNKLTSNHSSFPVSIDEEKSKIMSL